MAISLVGTATNATSNGGDLTVTLPVGTTTDDVVYAGYGMGGAADANLSSVTAGYTELADLFSDDSRDAQLGVYRKVQGGTPDTTWVAAGDGSASSGLAGGVIVLRGVDTSTPEDAATTTATGANSGEPDPPSITTVTANAWVLAFGETGQDNAFSAGPSGYSNFISDAQLETNHACFGAATKLVASAGAENPGAFTHPDDNTSDAWCAVTVAVRPLVATRGYPFSPNPMLPLLVR